MLDKYYQILNELRAGQRELAEFSFKESTDKDSKEFDVNQQMRYRLLIALQYYSLPSDEAMLQYLFRQEIQRARNDPFQGIGNAMELNAFLLSRFKNVQNVWLFTEAKHANFDTFCGLDYQYLLSAGISETYHFVAQAENEFKEAFYEKVGPSAIDCHVSENELKEWEISLSQTFSLSLDTLESQIELAAQLKEHEVLGEKLAQWKELQEVWDEARWEYLAYYEASLNNISGEIAANEQLLLLKKHPHLEDILISKLCSLYLKNGDVSTAWEKIKLVKTKQKQFGWKRRADIGRHFIEKILDVVLAFNSVSHVSAQDAYRWAKEEFQHLPTIQVYTNLLEKMAKAALLMKDISLHNNLQIRLDKEIKLQQQIMGMQNK